MEQSSIIRWLRRVALAEAISYLLLLVAVIAKRGFDQPAGVSVLGPLHGMLFLTYVTLVLTARDEAGWSMRETFMAVIASVIPFGGIAVERSMLRADVPSVREA